MANVLIIDDDEIICHLLMDLVHRIHHSAVYSQTLKDGVKKALTGHFDVVFLDVRMPDGNGLEAIEEIRQLPDAPEVIIITGAGDPDGAEIAIKNGAWDYLQKPFSPRELLLPIKRVLQYRDNLKHIRKPSKILKRDAIVGNSPQLKACLEKLVFAADGDAHVLITGETGTGKEVFAWAVHENSTRSGNNFVVVDCAALPETLVESALFGHEKGAFTGADRSKNGLIKMADGGTLFLDEVCELGPSIQKKFLRVLQEKRFRSVGGRVEIESNFRLLAATNRNPDQMVKDGLFREDLLYRLRTIPIELPPLRERKSDIKDLVNYHTDRICKKYGISPKGFSPDFIDALHMYKWPGNVRELVQVLESVISEARYEPILFPVHLPDHFRIQMARASVTTSRNKSGNEEKSDTLSEKLLSGDGPPPPFKLFRESILEDAEKKYFQHLLRHTAGNIQDACRLAELGRTRLYTLLKKHDVPS